jgi:hypothetical protein
MSTVYRFSLFIRALGWNGAGYLMYKGYSLFLTWHLAHRWDAAQFATWGSLMSAIFLAELWGSAGLRKSLPRFIPYFSHNLRTLTYCMSILMAVRIVTTTIVGILFVMCMPRLSICLNMDIDTALLWRAACLLIAENIQSILQLFYQAYFFNQYYTTISTLALCVEGLIILGILFSPYPLLSLPFLLTVRTVTTLTACVALIFYFLRYLVKPTTTQADCVPSSSQLPIIPFVIHSFYAWSMAIVYSFSQRNCLMIFITGWYGHSAGRMFKLTNDTAQVVHRALTRTVGVADTALLTHHMDHPFLFAHACTQLIHTISWLVIPSFACLLIVGIFSHHHHSFSLSLFCMLAFTYAIELILIPYERILEVKRRYLILVVSHIPLILAYFICFFFFKISLPAMFIITLHGARIVSLLIMKRFARHEIQSS